MVNTIELITKYESYMVKLINYAMKEICYDLKAIFGIDINHIIGPYISTSKVIQPVSKEVLEVYLSKKYTFMISIEENIIKIDNLQIPEFYFKNEQSELFVSLNYHMNYDPLQSISEYKINKKSYTLTLENSPKHIKMEYFETPGKFVSIAYNHDDNGKYYNENGIGLIVHMMDKKFKPAVTSMYEKLADTCSTEELMDIKNKSKWIKENSIPIDFYGDIKRDEDLMHFKMKFSN